MMPLSPEELTARVRSTIIGGGHVSTAASPLIGYCCDVEGNWQHWENYLSISLVLRREEEGGRLVLRDDCHFVFGGDVCDRGAGDIRVMRDLVELRERYADRVHLIMGNRDVNKLRLRFELADHTLKNSLGNVYWVPKTLSTGNTAPDKLKWMLLNTFGCPLTFELRRQELAQLDGCPVTEISDDAVVKSFLDLVSPEGLLMRYLTGAKLGAVVGDVCFCHGALNVGNIGKVPPGSLGAEAEAELRAPGPSEVSSDLLVEPLSPALASEGWDLCTGSVQQWYERLNSFANREIQDYMSRSDHYIAQMTSGEFHQASPQPSPPTTPRLTTNLSYSSTQTAGTVSLCSTDGSDVNDMRSGGAYWALVGGYNHPQPGSRLLQYGMGWTPDNEKNPSVIYENWLNDKGEPALPSPIINEYLRRSGIRFVATGHQPHGDAPLVMTTDDVVYIAADTSYSANVKWEGDVSISIGSHGAPVGKCRRSFSPMYSSVLDAGLTRGVSVSEVCFELSSDSSSTVVAFSHGVLSNGLQYAFPIQHSCNEMSTPHLKLLSNEDICPGWWIKGFTFSPHALPVSASEETIKYAYLASKSARYSVINQLFDCFIDNEVG